MKGLYIAIAAIVGLGVYAFKQGSDIAGKISYAFSPKFNFIKKGTGIFSTAFSFPLIITNNSTSQATISKVIGTVYSNGKLLGNYAISNPFVLMPADSTTVTLMCQASNIEVLRQAILAISNQSRPSLRFEGRIYTSLGSVPYNETV